MNMSWIDWCIVSGSLFFFIYITYRVRKYTRSVADFLAANRSAGRYLLTLSEGIAGLGAISIIAAFQVSYKVGFAAGWWSALGTPIMLILTLAGWVAYRFRETRALTLGQFLEMRYGRRFRIFAATICWSSGIIGFGIFPAVSANFFINYCGLPSTFPVAGIDFSTYHCLMFILVAVALYFTFSGGQVAVLLVDFLQSFFCNIVFVIILIILLINFSISEIFEGLLIAEKGKSMINPFEASQVEGFNPWFFIIGIISHIYNRLSFQGAQAYNSSAKSPHEAKMAGVLARFRWAGFYFALSVIPLVAYMIMHHPNYTVQAQQVTEKLSHIANDEVRDQMLVPMTMTLYMPIGMMGAFVAVMLAAFLSTNDTYLHSWGSIFVQDVIVPLRKKPLKPKQHLLILRLSIVFVAVFIYVFSCFFRQTQHLMLYIAVTGAIWLGGAGIVIIGGLYTRWGNKLGAYAALITGAIVGIAGMILEQLWKSLYDTSFFITGQEFYFIAMAAGTLAYIICSFAGKRTKFNLDKMLHRGKYIVKTDHVAVEAAASASKWSLKRLFGITEDFTFWDKLVYGWITFYTVSLQTLFFIMTILAFTVGLSNLQWANYHRYMLYVGLCLSVVFATWLTIGGIHDLIIFLKDMKTAKRDSSDDGRVIDHDYEEQNTHLADNH